jgi:hypothetical protein
MAWSSSNRRERLPANWDQLVAKVQARANGKCEAKVHAPGCDETGSECDHIEQGDDHSLTNLQWLSTACHARKTRLDNGLPKRLAMAPERHPGRL